MCVLPYRPVLTLMVPTIIARGRMGNTICPIWQRAGLLLPPRMERPARLRGLSAPNTHANQVSVYERSIFERVVTPGQPGLSALGHAPHY